MPYDAFEIIRDIARQAVSARVGDLGRSMSYNGTITPFAGSDPTVDPSGKKYLLMGISFWGQAPDGTKNIVGE